MRRVWAASTVGSEVGIRCPVPACSGSPAPWVLASASRSGSVSSDSVTSQVTKPTATGSASMAAAPRWVATAIAPNADSAA